MLSVNEVHKMKINYADIILKLRVTLNMSQQAMANFLGVSFASISRWERGLYEPTKLAKVRILELAKENNIELEETK